MNLVRIAAAGRPIRIGTRLLLLSPPSLRGFATLFAFLRGRIAAPEGSPPGWLPELAGDDAFREYATPLGATLLLYVTTRRDHPGLSLDDCDALAIEMDEDSVSLMVNAAFIRQEGGRPRKSRPGQSPEDGRPKGLDALDFGPIYESENLKRFSPEQLSSMSIDQFENALLAGKLEPDDALTFDEVMEIYEAHRPKAGIAGENPDTAHDGPPIDAEGGA
jgi:hypothetical protein